MVELAIPASEQLALRLQAVGDRLPDVLELGLRYWQTEQEATAVQRLRQMLAQHGLLAELEPTVADPSAAHPRSERLPPLAVEGRPASELILEERDRVFWRIP